MSGRGCTPQSHSRESERLRGVRHFRGNPPFRESREKLPPSSSGQAPPGTRHTRSYWPEPEEASSIALRSSRTRHPEVRRRPRLLPHRLSQQRTKDWARRSLAVSREDQISLPLSRKARGYYAGKHLTKRSRDEKGPAPKHAEGCTPVFARRRKFPQAAAQVKRAEGIRRISSLLR